MRLESRSAREYRWNIVVKLSGTGKTQSEIANLVGADQSSVSRILGKAKSGVPLKEKVNKGASPKLDLKQLEELREIINAGAEKQGFLGDQWGAKRLVSVVWRVFNVKYSNSGILKVVGRLGFSRQRYQQKDTRQPGTTTWKEEKIPAIKKKRRTRAG